MNGTSTFLASCHEYFVNGERNNGTFRIRPNISIPSFEVNCLFGNESAFTEIPPVNLPKNGLVFPKNESEMCPEPNCFTQSVQYHPSLDQIEALINSSENCSQTVEHSCYQILLSGFSSWSDRHGSWNSYWHGGKKLSIDSRYMRERQWTAGYQPNGIFAQRRSNTPLGCKCFESRTCQAKE